MAALLLASPEAGAVIDPSPPSPLTGTTTFIEWAPHLSAEGNALVFGGSTNPLLLGWESFSLDLQATCRDSPLLRLSDRDTAAGSPALAHPSVSETGRYVAWANWRGLVASKSRWDIEFLDRFTSVRTTVGSLIGPIDSPRVTLSASGAYVVAAEAVDAGGGNFTTERVHRFGTPASGCTNDCDCAINDLTVPSGAVADPQSSLSEDGRTVASGHLNGSVNLIRTVTFDGSSCFPTSRRALASHAMGGSDVTLSAGGDAAAWTTTADYDTGGSFADSNVWVWKQQPIIGSCPGLQCVPSPAGGTLVRILTDPGVFAPDSKPFVTADGQRVFFISRGDYGSQNAFQAQALWVVDLSATASWAPQRVSPLETVANANLVEHATANADGTAVAYQLFHDTDEDDLADARDLRMVLVDDDMAADLPEPPGMTAAHQPYEVQDVWCSHLGAGDVSVRYDVRQFRGDTRQLVTTLEAQAAGGPVQRLGPFVQQLRDEHVAEITRTVTLTDGDFDDITCRSLVLWGAGAQPDAVAASWQ